MESKPTDTKRELAAILFADIAGYTSLMQKDETTASILLHRFQLELETLVAEKNGRIVNFYGDGALCIFQNPLEAIECAIGLQTNFRNEPIVPVRIGIHSGTVVFSKNKVYGDSVNLASRIESMGVPGAILFSKKIRNEIKNQPKLRTISLGSFEFKNVEEPMELFALANEGFIIPRRDDMQGKIKAPVSSKPNILHLIAIIGIMIIVAFGLWKLELWEPSKESIPNNVNEEIIPFNSLAVLPFTNMSSNKENEYFTDGMHDDLLTYISKIGSIKVISRTSVLRFKNTKQPIPEIGQMLGVAHVLEGSVRREGNNIRINVQLIKAASDEHLWSEIYDRKLNMTNIFDIQTEIALEISNTLKATISTKQKQALSDLPTENLLAYENYLKARRLMEVRNAESLYKAKTLLEDAIELDSNFALAYVHLGSVYFLLPQGAGENAEESYSTAMKYLEKGMAINDNLADAYALKGIIIGDSKGNLEESSAAFEKAIAINPNYARTYHWYALTVRRISRDFSRAAEIFQNAVRLDPLSPAIIGNSAEYQFIQKDFNKAKTTLKKGILIEPNFPFFLNRLSIIYASIGRLDSAAICTFQGLLNNKVKGLYMSYYLHDLLQLEMYDELLSELKSFIPQDQLDSSTVHIISYYLNAYQEKFDNNWGSSILSPFFMEDIKFNSLYSELFYKRAFKEVITNYEKKYPSFDEDNHLSYFSWGALTSFQCYIYSLQKEGRTQKAEQLLSKYGQVLLETPEGQDLWPEESKLMEVYQINYSMMQGEHDLAIKQIANYFRDGCLEDWKNLDISPFLDAIRDEPEYMAIMNEVKTKVSAQREIFSAYLKGKNQSESQQ